MRNIIFKLFIVIFLLIMASIKVNAEQFNILVIPTDIFSVCDNYFCFPEASNIVAEDVISSIKLVKNLNVKNLSIIRQKANSDYKIKQNIINLITTYDKQEKIDFTVLNSIAKTFDCQYALLIDTYTINDKTELKRNLWDTLEISTAFKITYPFELKTSAVLVDSENSLVMWSGKYTKTVSDSYGYFKADNQTQSLSQLEKIKQYSYDIVSKNISQNIYMRLFPKQVRTFTVKKGPDNTQPKYVPNALEHLSDPHIRKELDVDTNKKFRDFDLDDFVF